MNVVQLGCLYLFQELMIIDFSTSYQDHNCLDTILSDQKCPTRTRTGRLEKDGNIIQIEQKSEEGCNCDPCTFKLSDDWIDIECVKSSPRDGWYGGHFSNGNDEECPCHWQRYKWCQQLSHS